MSPYEFTDRIAVIDSHTGGEPTRVVIQGGPPLGAGGLAERRTRFQREFDSFRSAIINEPRGSDVLVGGLLCEPEHPDSVAGVIFFNNVGCLGMCVHATIGVVTTLAHLGRLKPGPQQLDTPVGTVAVCLHEDGSVSVTNVPSYRWLAGQTVEIPGHPPFVGDVAWGGNWFYLVQNYQERFALSDATRLSQLASQIREGLRDKGVRGPDGAEIDHVELFGPPQDPSADSKNFVLCPGNAYDRSPCGTGTSAKVACLMADGKLQPGEVWRQEGIVGSIFQAQGEWDGDRVRATVTGKAYLTAESTLLLQRDDPYQSGF